LLVKESFFGFQSLVRTLYATLLSAVAGAKYLGGGAHVTLHLLLAKIFKL